MTGTSTTNNEIATPTLRDRLVANAPSRNALRQRLNPNAATPTSTVATSEADTRNATLMQVRGAWLALEWAEMIGLPLPLAVRAGDLNDGGRVEFQLTSRDELVTWAERLEIDIEDRTRVVAGQGIHDWSTAIGDVFDVPVFFVAVKPHPVKAAS